MSEAASLAARRGAAAFLALALGAVAMGISPIFVRLADVGPFASAFWRVTLALPALYAWMRLAERERAAARSIHPARRARRPRLRRRSLVLAFGDPAHQRRQRDVFRHHGADLGGRVRLDAVRREGRARDADRPRAVPDRRRGAAWRRACDCGPRARWATVSAWRRACFSASISWPCRRRGGDTGAARVTFEASVVTAAVLFAVAVAVERRLAPASLAGVLALLGMSWVSHAGGQGLLSVALGRLPGDLLLAGDFPRGGGGRAVRLPSARRADLGGAGARRAVDHGRHLRPRARAAPELSTRRRLPCRAGAMLRSAATRP